MNDTATMRALTLLGPEVTAAGAVEPFRLEGQQVGVALLRLPAPRFEPERAAHTTSVLVRKRAFALNFRDRGLLFRLALTAPRDAMVVLGSEFVGEVVAVGAAVRSLAVGDRVIPDHCYRPARSAECDGDRDGEFGSSRSDSAARPAATGPPTNSHGSGNSGRAHRNGSGPPSLPSGSNAAGGLLTNQGSAELEVLPARRLLRLPAALDDLRAVTLPVSGTTSYAMLRRLAASRGDATPEGQPRRILLTAAASNTSLALLAALRAASDQSDESVASDGSGVAASCAGLTAKPSAGWQVEVSGTTSTPRHRDGLAAAGLDRLFVIPRDSRGFLEHSELWSTYQRHGGFDALLDPFVNLHFGRALEALAVGGTYVGCGLFSQSPHAPGGEIPYLGRPMPLALVPAMGRNLTLVTSCLGETEDLRAAVADAAAGRFAPPLDAVLSDSDGAAAFLERSWVDPDRFGKVVFRYATP